MIIALASPPVVDLSRTVEELAKRHGLTPRFDPTRSVVESYGFQTLYDMPEALQRKVREDLIRDHLAFVSRQDAVVLDYSVFGWLADWMRWFWNHTPTEKWDEILALAAAITERYTIVHHVESGPEKPYDGFVWRDRRNTRQINGLLKLLFDELEVGPKLRSGPMASEHK
jgi:hypothetical protein